MKTKFTSVWDALESDPDDSKKMEIKSSLLILIEKSIQRIDAELKSVLNHLEISEREFIELKQGRAINYEMERLIRIAHKIEIYFDVGMERLTDHLKCRSEAPDEQYVISTAGTVKERVRKKLNSSDGKD